MEVRAQAGDGDTKLKGSHALNKSCRTERSDSEPLLQNPRFGTAVTASEEVADVAAAAAPQLRVASRESSGMQLTEATICECERAKCWRCGCCCAELSVPWWRYAVLGFTDVEANFLVVLAY